MKGGGSDKMKTTENRITEIKFFDYLKSQGFILNPDQFWGSPPYPVFLNDHSTKFNLHLTAKITEHITMIFGMVRDSYLALGDYGKASIQYTDTRKHERDWYTHLFQRSNDLKKLSKLDLRNITNELKEAV